MSFLKKANPNDFPLFFVLLSPDQHPVPPECLFQPSVPALHCGHPVHWREPRALQPEAHSEQSTETTTLPRSVFNKHIIKQWLWWRVSTSQHVCLIELLNLNTKVGLCKQKIKVNNSATIWNRAIKSWHSWRLICEMITFWKLKSLIVQDICRWGIYCSLPWSEKGRIENKIMSVRPSVHVVCAITWKKYLKYRLPFPCVGSSSLRKVTFQN